MLPVILLMLLPHQQYDATKYFHSHKEHCSVSYNTIWDIEIALNATGSFALVFEKRKDNHLQEGYKVIGYYEEKSDTLKLQAYGALQATGGWKNATLVKHHESYQLVSGGWTTLKELIPGRSPYLVR
ncbi:hypothetical protein LX64_00285 [Chitinophaga skermanii]|uniref:Uncharacterized protein n=1 Tax=Chitinophaga skermanii TaxID=331697 RepID=A0A327R1E9_9BACT|nr:hypothetical protein [Chitinophaga skermanii]RAJ10679.1 hypothetical protein LX64_00285 [Chitinophaga skermanii]